MSTTAENAVTTLPIALSWACPRCSGLVRSTGTCYYEGRERTLFECDAKPKCVHDVTDPDDMSLVMRGYPVEFVVIDGRQVLVQPGGDHD